MLLKVPCTHPHPRSSALNLPECGIAAAWITHDLGRGKLMFLPTSLQFASACREHVLYPLALAAVGERDDEAVWHWKDVYRCAIDFPRLATHMRENAEPRQPTRE